MKGKMFFFNFSELSDYEKTKEWGFYSCSEVRSTVFSHLVETPVKCVQYISPNECRFN